MLSRSPRPLETPGQELRPLLLGFPVTHRARDVITSLNLTPSALLKPELCGWKAIGISYLRHQSWQPCFQFPLAHSLRKKISWKRLIPWSYWAPHLAKALLRMERQSRTEPLHSILKAWVCAWHRGAKETKQTITSGALESNSRQTVQLLSWEGEGGWQVWQELILGETLFAAKSGAYHYPETA